MRGFPPGMWEMLKTAPPPGPHSPFLLVTLVLSWARAANGAVGAENRVQVGFLVCLDQLLRLSQT